MSIKKGTKYKLADKARRNEIVRKYKQDNPEATLRDMAAVFGLSHTRIGIILNNLKDK
jgi:hypothetical protein